MTNNPQAHKNPLFILPALIVLFGVTIFPFAFAIFYSFTDFNLVKGGTVKFIGLANYLSVLTDPRFHNSLIFTVSLTVAAVTLELSLGLGIALLLKRKLRGINVFRMLLFVPMVLCPVIVGLMFRLIADPVGILNYLLGILHLPQPLWLADKTMAPILILLTDAWQWTPFVVLILTAALEAVPKDLIDAGKIDGASSVQTFSYITLPLIKPVVMIVLFFRSFDLIKIFDVIWLLTKGGPSIATESVSMYIYRVSFHAWNIGKASAASLILFAFILLLATPFITRLSKELVSK